VADLAPRALDKHQSLEFESDGHCIVAGHPTLLEVLVRNLVDNAVRYSPDAARIVVRVAGEPRTVVLQVEDSGAGLSEPDLRRLGERFFRVVGHDESGSGLGWSIVRRIAAVHGAQLSAQRSVALGGLAVRVGFDAAGAAAGR
jgi:two-component system sensor histidine kinase QseC